MDTLGMMPTLSTRQTVAGREEVGTLRGKQGGCCRQLVSQLRPLV